MLPADAKAVKWLLGVFAVKAAVLVQLGNHPLLAPSGGLDSAYYVQLATSVAHGDTWLLQPSSFQGHVAPVFFVSPLYVYFVALLLKLSSGSLEAIRWTQIALGTLAVGLLAATARRWYGARASWATGILATACGLFTFFEILIVQTALDPLLTALDLYLLTRAIDRNRWTSWAIAGFALGVHALNRPNMLVVLLLLGAVMAIRSIRYSAAFVVAGLLAIAPATIRNWRVAHDFVLISSHGGLNFLIGNGPEADGTFARVSGIEPSIRGQWLDAPKVVQQAIGHEPSSSEVSTFFFRRSAAWIRDHPIAELRLLVRKAWYTLSSRFLTLDHSFPFFARELFGPLTFLVIGPAFIVPLGLVGLWAARRSQPGHVLLVAFVVSLFVSIVIFFVAARYRLPLQVALTIPAGGMVASLIDSARRKMWRKTAIGIAGSALLVGLAVWPTGLDDGRAEEEVRMGLLEIQQGDTTSGEGWIQRAIDRHAPAGVAHLRAGQAYEKLGRSAEAIAHYERAAAIDSNEPSVQFVLGRALLNANRDAEAIAAFRRAQRGPQEIDATELLALVLARAGRINEALPEFERAVRLDPASAPAHLNYAVALATLGRREQAVAEAETALRLDVNYTKAKDFLAAIRK